MSRSRKPPSKTRSLLSEEDHELWATVAETLKPVRLKGRITPKADIPDGIGAAPPPPARSARAPLNGAAAKSPDVTSSTAARRAQAKSPPPIADFDRRKAKRIAGGRIEIEARIDLHGMRAAEAHAALRGFIMRCYGQGKRNLLVITGKGATADLRDRPFELDDRRDRGVLKRHVPLWLSEPDLRVVVVSFTTAHARHGGDGALYIQLRSRFRTPAE